ncbi:hypothetical protein WJX72_001826 [[Myrmecia] bisecta]|uniref:Uncharacterized protein n=1 Tax=[Myrmecia] bisecta TaxID=41462 RepID=A0AAW1PFR8_9CHLO
MSQLLAPIAGCTDYVLFPLLFIVDSVALTHQPPGARRPPAAGDQTSPQGEAAIPIPAAKSDRVAERVLQCIEVVVRRCTMDSGDQMIQLLERIAVVAGLPVDRAAEEVRHRAIQCLNSLLSNMGPSQLGGPITALQDPKHTPMVGYLAHLMLSAAEQEAKVGHTGSKALRATALQALRRLIVAVGTADGLAFVLPGIASGLAKAMMTAGTSHGTRARSGAAAGSAAAAEAVKGMVALLTITLGDRACRPILAPAGESEDPEAAALWPLDSLDSTLRSTEATLEAMRKLAVKHAKARGGAESGVDEEETTPTLPSKPQPNCAARAGPETMVVVRDEAWVKQGAQRIHNLLTQALPLLCSHPRPAVRAAVAQGAVELLAQCSLALQQSTELLLEIIFTLAQDEWPQVPEDAVKAVTVRLIAGLVRALKTGEEAASQAGGSALRGLIDHLLGDLEKTLPKGDASSAAGGLGSGSTGGWQCSAAAVVAVISEVLYGASPAWAQSQARQQAQRRQAQQATQHAQQAHGLTAQHAQQQADQGAQPNGDAQKDQQRQQQLQTLEGVVGLVMDALTVETLWGVPTHLDMATDAANPPTPQVLGENALLMRVLLETVGVAARAIGLRFTANGRILRTVLLPVLERMGDPSPFVAAAAATAVGSICMHCGYASLQGLVAANADYIVDGVCRQLRHLDEYPRAPHLFAALLRKAGVAPSLLPLLAEPARAAFQGLSILARRKRPRHTAAFLQALVEIVSGAAADADDWMGMADWRSRVHAAAVLASAAADVTGPLLTSSDLKVMLLAVDVAVGGLRALQATTAFTQLEEYHIAPYVVKPDKIEPVPPETPALLPSVHALWGPLIAALKDSRVAAVEKALATLAELAELAGGDFLARRTQLEAWPVLARLLKYGPSQQRASLEAGQDDGKLAPAVVQRVRHAVLSCLASMAGSSAARAAVQGLASPMVEAAAMYLGGNELPAVKEAASQVLLAVASFDPDAGTSAAA